MKYTVAAVSCMIDKETKEVIMDPDSSQLKVFINNNNTLHSFKK